MDRVKLEELVNEGLSIRNIASNLNFSASTIRYWLSKYDLRTDISLNKNRDGFISLESFINGRYDLYSYLYGLYLGDGCVYRQKKGVDALTIALDSKYIELVEEVRKSLELFSGNKVRVYLRGNCYNLTIYGKHIKDIFIKYGKGKKHNNYVYLPNILLKNICYKSMAKGLFQSDGSYYYDKHNKKYFYSFTNMSKDIIDIFTMCLDNLDIGYDLQYNSKNVYRVGIRRKLEVIKFMNIFGIKK